MQFAIIYQAIASIPQNNFPGVKMKTKNATTLTTIVIVIAIVAAAAAIAWLSANPQNTGGPGHSHSNNYTPEAPPPTANEVPSGPNTSPSQAGNDGSYPLGNIPGDTTSSDNGYPTHHQHDYEAPPQYTYPQYTPYNNEEYPPPHNDPYPEESDSIIPPTFTSEPLPDHIIQQITGITFHETTPFGYDYLAYLTVTHVNFDGESTHGHLIVAADIAHEVLDIFREIYEGGFPIHSIKLIDYFDASDYYSMAANNSHAFNFRYIAGTSVISRHGFGIAIDINPIQNPYIRGDTIWPAAGAAYLDRSYVRPGMIVPGDVVYNAFISRGWIWGGHWTSPRDYHHFEKRR